MNDLKYYKNIKISARLERVLQQLERTEAINKEKIAVPAQGRKDGRKEKDFPLVLGNA